MLYVDMSQMKGLNKALRKQPKKMRRIVQLVLNKMAYGTRMEILRVVPKLMTVRTPSNLRKHTIYQRAKFGSVRTMFSLVGSTRGKRWTGLREQEYGKDDPRTHKGTLAARVNTPRKVMIQPSRLRAGRKFAHPGDHGGSTKQEQTLYMMQHMARKRSKKPFIVGSGHPTLMKGLYRFHGRAGASKSKPTQKLQMLQRMPEGHKDIKRYAWMIKSIRSYFSRRDWVRPYEAALKEKGFLK